MEDEQQDFGELIRLDVETDIQVRDAAKREIDIRIMPWGQVIQSVNGTEEVSRGAFDDVDPSKVRLFPPEHRMGIGIGHDGKPQMIREPTGKGISLENREDGAYMTFKVAKTQSGDEQIALALDGIVDGASAEIRMVPGGTVTERRLGRQHRRHVRLGLAGVSTTHNPAYTGAGVLAVRTAPVQEKGAMGEDQAITPVPEPVDLGPVLARMDAFEQSSTAKLDTFFAEFNARQDAAAEQARSAYIVPVNQDKQESAKASRGEWMSIVLRMLSGERVDTREIEARIAADLITADNLGVVPEAFLSEMIGIIDPARPFLATTRRLETPSAGMQLTVPVIETRPTVGVQAEEKDELTSTPTSITDTSFNPITIGGYGDISLQLLKRSSPSYLSLYLELLAESYAVMSEDKAVDALLAQGGVHNGGTVVADTGPGFGQAWANAAAVSRLLRPTHIWMSSSAVQAFIDAKEDGTNAPLYTNLAASFDAATGTGGKLSGLIPVHVPALDDESADIIVGPSRAFGWAEDGSFVLQVDVPSKAGKDVALVGLLWYAPLYPAAFTKYAIGS